MQLQHQSARQAGRRGTGASASQPMARRCARPLAPRAAAQLSSVQTSTTRQREQQEQAAAAQPLPFRVGFKAEQGRREGMEDELHVVVDLEHAYLFAGCYDGHGGSAAAQWLKLNLYDGIKDQMQRHHQGFAESNAQIPDGLTAAFEKMDRQLLDHLEAQGGEELAQAGATATVVMLWANRVVAANVGDSQAFIYRRGQAVPLTTAHRVYGGGEEMDLEIARVRAVGGWVYDGRVCNVLAVSRAFGDYEFKGKGLAHLVPAGVERGYWDDKFAKSVKFTGDPVIVTPDSCDMQIEEDDEFLVLSTDGLWDVFEPREAMLWARKELQKGLSPNEVADSLIKIALKRHTTDNTSVVVVDLKGEEYWRASGGKGGGRGAGPSLGGLFGGLFGGAKGR